MSAPGRHYRLREQRVRPRHPPTSLAVSAVARLRQPAPIRRALEGPRIAARLYHPVQIASASRPAARLAPLFPVRLAPPFPSGLVRLLPSHLTPLLLVGPGPLLPEALPLAPGPSAVRLAWLTVSSPTARRSLTTRFRV